MADYALEGPRWASNTISWSIAQANLGGQPAQFNSFFMDDRFLSDIQAAFDRWGSVANLSFVQSADSADVNIRLGLATFDGPYGTLGEASYFYAQSSGAQIFLPNAVVRFDSAENYSFQDGEEQLAGGVTFETVALHEIGHTLGLDHFSGVPAIMNPSATRSVQDLTSSDIKGIRALHGAPLPTQLTLAPDSFTAGSGSETILGRDGNDTVGGASGFDIIYGNLGDDQLFGNLGRDTLFGGQGDDRLYGGQDNDVVYGNLAADAVYGNLGDDTLFGGQGDDLIFGGQGNDLILGNLGNDRLVGGAGADRFVFGQGNGADLISGFKAGEGDRLDFGGQAYSFGDDASGGTIFVLSGGGTVTLLGTSPAQVGGAILA